MPRSVIPPPPTPTPRHPKSKRVHGFQWDKKRLQESDLFVIKKYEVNDIPPPKVKTDIVEYDNEEEHSDDQYKFIIPPTRVHQSTTSELSVKEKEKESSKLQLPKVGSSINSIGTRIFRSTSTIQGNLSGSKAKLPVNTSKSGASKVTVSSKVKRKVGKSKTKTCMQEGTKLVWKTRGQGVCADVDSPLKKFNKPLNKMPPLVLYDYLNIWDVSSLHRRYEMLRHFLKSYVSIDPLDLDYYLSRGGTLLLTRFTIGMQIAFLRRKPVWIYFQALGVFMKSLQGERFMYEFLRMGGLTTAFEILGVNEMSLQDKTNVFYFLYRLIDGQGGTRVKEYICKDPSALESVVDCLTMCKDPAMINYARLYLQNLCVGNTMANLQMISKYVTSILTCDFNPPLQQMACQVLPCIMRQNEETARHCYTYLVDALRTEFSELLIDIGDMAIAIMGTNVADDFLVVLISAAQPSTVGEDLGAVVSASSMLDEEDEADPEAQTRRKGKGPPTDGLHRQQCGALSVISYMLKNRTEFADWMVEKGVIGSLLAAIGTSDNTEAQLLAIRLLLLIHELSADGAVALTFLVPQKLLVVILEEEEKCLGYVTAVMCTNLRRLGRLVQKHWEEWFDLVVLPDSPNDLNDTDNLSPGIEEIITVKENLDSLIGKDFPMIVDSAPLPIPNPSVFNKRSDDARTTNRSLYTTFKDPLTPGELRILQDPDLEPFRKHIQPEAVLTQDEFERYYADKYAEDSDSELGGMEMALLRDAENALTKFADTGRDTFITLYEESESKMLLEGEGEFSSFVPGSAQGASQLSQRKSIDGSTQVEGSVRGSTLKEKTRRSQVKKNLKP